MKLLNNLEKKHECGGIIELVKVADKEFFMCDNCQAFMLKGNGIILPSGTDYYANLNAWERGENASPHDAEQSRLDALFDLAKKK